MGNFNFDFNISVGDLVNLIALLYYIFQHQNRGLTPKQYGVIIREIAELKRLKEKLK